MAAAFVIALTITAAAAVDSLQLGRSKSVSVGAGQKVLLSVDFGNYNYTKLTETLVIDTNLMQSSRSIFVYSMSSQNLNKKPKLRPQHSWHLIINS